METKAVNVEKSTLVEMIRRFIAQRSGIDYRDYGDRSSFMSDYREILADGRDARRLLEWIDGRDGITADDILSAGSGNRRLEFTTDGNGRLRLDYTTGQYFPTEYRAAACSLLAGIAWRYLATDYPPDGAEDVRKMARRIFGRGLAGRWFR